MKTIKITSSLLILSIAITSFGQLQTLKDRFFTKKTHYILTSGIQYETTPDNSSSATSVPEVIRSFYAESVAIEYGADLETEDLNLENWMTTPFEVGIQEKALELEDWMTTPFEVEIQEDELELEDWMTRQFEVEILEEDLHVEAWMARPFGAPLDQDQLVIESWMTLPFYAAR